VIAEREIDRPEAKVHKISASAGRAGEAAFRRINSPSINHKIYGERFVKARVLACFLPGTCAGLAKSAS